MSTNVETMVGKFVWHDHRSGDVDKATSFYSELFGWEVEVWQPESMSYPMIKANGRMHGGFGATQGGDEPPHWIGHVLVEDADETAQKAESAGGTVLGKMDIPEVGRIVVIADPQGAVISGFQGTMESDSPPAEGTFVWDELTTSDVEAAKAFYAEVFGWEAKDEDMGGTTYTIFRRADETSVGGCMATPDGVQAPPHWLVYIHADDTDETVAKAKELGATVLMEAMEVPEIGRFAILQDPTGAAFGVFQNPPE